MEFRLLFEIWFEIFFRACVSQGKRKKRMEEKRGSSHSATLTLPSSHNSIVILSQSNNGFTDPVRDDNTEEWKSNDVQLKVPPAATQSARRLRPPSAPPLHSTYSPPIPSGPMSSSAPLFTLSSLSPALSSSSSLFLSKEDTVIWIKGTPTFRP